MRKNLIDIITALFIFLFVYAAVSKLLEYEKFVIQIGQSPLLTGFANVIAWFIPLSEIVIAICLVAPKTRMLGLYASFTLMIAFTIYILLTSQFSDYVPCSCGGVIQNLTWTQHMVLNLFFVVGAVIAILLHSLKETTPVADQYDQIPD